MTDEIHFKGFESDNEVYTQDGFTRVCKILFVWFQPDVPMMCSPLIEDAVTNLRRVMEKEQGMSREEVYGWFCNFFEPRNMIRFRSTYEVKQALIKKRHSLTGSHA